MNWLKLKFSDGSMLYIPWDAIAAIVVHNESAGRIELNCGKGVDITNPNEIVSIMTINAGVISAKSALDART